MIKTLIEGTILGLTTGTACLVTCSPIYLPYLISEDRKLGKSILAVLEISAGRFVSYLAFGAIAGYTGAQIASVNRELFTSYSLKMEYFLNSLQSFWIKDEFVDYYNIHTQNLIFIGSTIIF